MFALSIMGQPFLRLLASKQIFSPAIVGLRRTARRRIGAAEAIVGSAASTEPTAGTAVATAAAGAACSAEAALPRAEQRREPENFPTGLVMSKHFREASTGREILMLEVEKVTRGGWEKMRGTKVTHHHT